MGLDLIIIGLSIATLLILLAVLFFLLEIKLRIGGELRATFVYLILAILILISRRIYYIFYQSDLAKWPYVSDVLSLIFAILLLLAAYDFYRILAGITDAKVKNSSDKKRRKTGKTKNVRAVSARIFGNPKIAAQGNLGAQSSLLEQAFEKGYISKESYKRGKEKINKVYNNLKQRYL
ncbi:hypothetical protein HY449_03345 [Candidatus Pacearchaeota archaeon]|nr:hypothetical protein [Candidatus Pacearchaeota archaeon]